MNSVNILGNQVPKQDNAYRLTLCGITSVITDEGDGKYSAEFNNVVKFNLDYEDAIQYIEESYLNLTKRLAKVTGSELLTDVWEEGCVSGTVYSDSSLNPYRK